MSTISAEILPLEIMFNFKVKREAQNARYGLLEKKKREKKDGTQPANWTTPKFTFITTKSTSKISAKFSDLNRCPSVFIELKVGKNTFLFLPFQMATVINPRARVPTQHQTNRGAARVTYRWARASASKRVPRAPKKLS